MQNRIIEFPNDLPVPAMLVPAILAHCLSVRRQGSGVGKFSSTDQFGNDRGDAAGPVEFLSQEAASSPYLVDAYGDLMDRLEREGLLNRDIEFLPSPDDMAQRARDSDARQLREPPSS